MRTAARLWLDDLRRDISHDWRGFARDPGFAAAAVVPLALGIGATTAVFCIVNTVLLRPLPYIDIVSLVRIVERLPARNTSTARTPEGHEVDQLCTFADSSAPYGPTRVPT
jgi:hypothetical protein